MRTLIAITLALLALLAVAVSAQETPAPTPATAGPPALAGASGAAPVSAGPVTVPPPDERTMSFHRSSNVFYLANYFVAALVSILILFTGWSARMRDFALRIGRYWFLAIPIYLAIFATIDFFVVLPLAYLEHNHEQRYGLSDATLGEWFQGELALLPSGILFVSILMILFYAVVRRSPRRWWIYIAIPVFLIEIGSGLIGYWTAPMSRTFTPVQDKAFEAEVRSLADRAGVRGAQIVQVSKGSEIENGPTVDGWMGRSRIVVASPAETRLSRDEQLFLTARQLGTFRLHEKMKYNLLRALLSIFSFYLLYRTSLFLIARYKERWGFDRISDFASWPLFPVLFNVFFLIVQPVSVGFMRHHRQEADRFGLELTRNNDACARSFVTLASDDIVNPTPGPIYRLWRSFSPPLAERVEFCNTYHPWRQGEPLKYSHLITEPAARVEPVRQVGGNRPEGR